LTDAPAFLVNFHQEQESSRLMAFADISDTLAVHGWMISGDDQAFSVISLIFS
jgi:hypothetical protein